MLDLLPRPTPTRRRDLPSSNAPSGRPHPAAPARRRPRLARRANVLVLALILLVAAAFRVHGFEWDAAFHQHPDERFMTIVAAATASPSSLGAYFDTPRSSLDPYARGFDRYAYGQLPLTLTRLLAERTGDTTFDTIYRDGRALSILADLGSVLFGWLLARRALGVRAAHLTAILLALSVENIQLAHFFTVDSFVTCFVTASLFFGQRAWQRDRLPDAALAGVLAGLATASKVSALLLLPVLAVTLVWPRRGRPTREGLLDGVTAFGVLLVGAFVAFRVAEPYAFLGPNAWNLRLNTQWIADKVYFAQISSGAIDVPYMIQWAGTPAYTFVLQGIVQWGMGPALGLAGLLGTGLAAWRFVRGAPRERELLLVLLWTVVNLVYFGGQFAKFLRYLLPTYPTLAILAAYVVLEAADRLAAVRRWELDALHRWLAPAVVSATAVWALAFSAIYDQPHSRVQASSWIYANVPAGATLATEHWDDRLPLPMPEGDPRQYRYLELGLYDPDSPEKRAKLEAQLDQADYIVLASRRLVDSIPRLPERYPLATTYYRLLLGGQLGYQQLNRTQVEPHLGPLAVDDSRAQEDFTVYDHPLVEVWRKSPDYSPVAVRQLLDAVPLDRVANVRPIDGGKGALLETPTETTRREQAGTWSALFHRDDLANRWPLPVWLLAAEVLALSAVPMLWRALPFLPDGGFGVSKVLGLAGVAYVAWLAASLRLAPFGRPLLLGAWLLLVAGSLAAVWPRRRAFLAWLAARARALLVVELVFLAGFALSLGLRMVNPDLWHPNFGGEKPMNFAYLNAVVKSESFPPYDPWFAGGVINYYYYGLVLVASLVKLTGVVPSVAFNLAEPTLYGALCAGVFSLAFGLTLPARARVGRGLATLAGVLAVLFVAVLGNLDAGLQVLDQLWRVGGAVAPSASGLARLVAGVVAVARGAPFPPLDFWRSTRFIGPEDVGPIHEFPYFTWLYGDLHAHQIALPLTVAVLVVALSLVRALRHSPARFPWPAVLLAGWLVGMLRATNTWDFPTYAAVVVLAVALGVVPGLLRLDRRAVLTAVGSLLVFGATVLLSFWPYLQRYQLFYTGVEPSPARTALSQYLTIHGLFLFCGGSLLAWYGLRARRRTAEARRREALLTEPGYYGLWLPAAGISPAAGLAGWTLLASALVGLLMVLAGYPTRGVVLFGAGAAAAAVVGTWRRADRALHAALLGAGLLATLIPEFVALQGDIGRMNTVFKFYYQAWVLLAVAGAVSVAWLARRAGRDPVLRLARPAWLALAGLLVLAAACYPVLASEAKLGLRFAPLPPGLDGMAFMDVATYRDPANDRGDHDLDLPADARALRWLQDSVVGTPTVLEGRAPVYRWGSRVSIYTGLPTVLGWDVHESQQRAGYVPLIQERAADVERAYVTPSGPESLAIMRRYGVRYVYVGGLERAYYPAAGLAKFRTMPELRLVYDADGVQIYEVTA